MARTSEDARRDSEVLKTLSNGDRVEYVSKSGEIKRGIVTGIVKYTGCYGNDRPKSRYSGYSSVTVTLDNSNKHINVSPRNLKKISDKKKRKLNDAEKFVLEAKIRNLLSGAVGETIAQNILDDVDGITENTFMDDVIEYLLELSNWERNGSYDASDLQKAIGHELCARLGVEE